MGLCVTTHANCGRSKNTRKPSGIIKLRARPKIQLRSVTKRFWYTTLEGATCVATNSDRTIIPEQTNTYNLNPSDFSDEPYPWTFAPGGVWPPSILEDVVCASGREECVGDRCYTNDDCEDPFCSHTFGDWQKATADWEEHFELRQTDARGIGVFAKHDFRRHDVLGWYAGELKTMDNCGIGDYLMEMEMGDGWANGSYEDDTDSEYDYERSDWPTLYIDGEEKGNWTRYINHSCDPHAIFRMRRVGGVKIMTVHAIRNVSAEEELTVSYGDAYYGMDTQKVCCCGTNNCVGKRRQQRDKEKGKESGRKAKVKKCRRNEPL